MRSAHLVSLQPSVACTSCFLAIALGSACMLVVLPFHWPACLTCAAANSSGVYSESLKTKCQVGSQPTGSTSPEASPSPSPVPSSPLHEGALTFGKGLVPQHPPFSIMHHVAIRMHCNGAWQNAVMFLPGVVLAWYNGTGPHYDGSKLAIQLLPWGDDPPASRRSVSGILLAMDAAGSWGYVCKDDGNNKLDAMVLCRTLGWRGQATLKEHEYSSGTPPNVTVAWSRLVCPDWKAGLKACSHQDANWASWCNCDGSIGTVSMPFRHQLDGAASECHIGRSLRRWCA